MNLSNQVYYEEQLANPGHWNLYWKPNGKPILMGKVEPCPAGNMMLWLELEDKPLPYPVAGVLEAKSRVEQHIVKMFGQDKVFLLNSVSHEDLKATLSDCHLEAGPRMSFFLKALAIANVAALLTHFQC